jgi:hypothetical protein
MTFTEVPSHEGFPAVLAIIAHHPLGKRELTHQQPSLFAWAISANEATR